MTEDLADEIIAKKVRPFFLQNFEKVERKFVDDTTSRGALTTEEALQALNDWRLTALEDFDNRVVPEVKAWLLGMGKAN